MTSSNAPLGANKVNDTLLWQTSLTAPLFTDWQQQYVKLCVPGVAPGMLLRLEINGAYAPVQYTGRTTSEGVEVMLRLGFTRGETATVSFYTIEEQATAHLPEEISLEESTEIGVPGRLLVIAPPQVIDGGVTGPFAGFAGFPMSSAIYCAAAFEGATLRRISDGALFTDYQLAYRFAGERSYTMNLRCYKHECYVEICESFSLLINSALIWTLNPEKDFSHIISRDSFEGDNNPSIEPLGATHPRDLLCRLQIPMVGDYFIPNNRGWFAFFDEHDEARGMIGVLGLYGDMWEEPVANMPELLDKGGTVEWHSSLDSGKRYWLLYAGPLEKEFTPERRFVFHRVHAEFNALRLDEHLDLTGTTVYDAHHYQAPALFNDRYRERIEQAVACMPFLLDKKHPTLQAISQPTPENQQRLIDAMLDRLGIWVRQFQGWRSGVSDGAKSVIGFSRVLRGLLINYELLRKEGALSEEQIGQCNAYFIFAARRILDEGRWPHARTWLHPDHPESVRNFYSYGGEHQPDRLIWTNSLPNFQSDQTCALAHIAVLFSEHPDADHWLHFALDDIDRQLTAFCGKSGAWEESINYALYTFSYFVITFKVLKARCRIDYFNDERMRRYAGWLCRFFGPYDKRFETYTWPGIGNSVFPQNEAEYLLCYAGELAEDDPLRSDCLAVWQRITACRAREHYPVVLAAMAPLGDDAFQSSPAQLPLRPLTSEVMDEVGVAMRDRHTEPEESYLFQKIGFAKDHYEGDESSFNWYAKGTPLLMDYGAYTQNVSGFSAHNLVEIVDEDPFRRGYLANHLFTASVDYTHCEVPVTLKLLWGEIRSFAEVDQLAQTNRLKTPYHYIGDNNPVGPKSWKVRQLFFVKPDYLVLFDRVYGQAPHRYNLHFTGDNLQQCGSQFTATGRFDLDLLAFVQHPTAFDVEQGELIPTLRNSVTEANLPQKHAQHFFRLYNKQDGIYRTVLFARERERLVQISAVGVNGVKVVTPEYTDYLFLHNEVINEALDDVQFIGRAGWIRRTTEGTVSACMADGNMIQAFNKRFTGRGPWSYNMRGDQTIHLHGPTPHTVDITAV